MSKVRTTHGFYRVLTIIAGLLLLISSVVISSGQGVAHAAQARSQQRNGKIIAGYFPDWSIYGEGYLVKDLATNGAAGEMTAINYAFANISSNYQCQIGDSWADYQKPFTAAQAVNGQADTWTQPLAGNFNQFKELKALYPNLKLLISIGGWTWSSNFSAAAEPQNVSSFVSSCIDLFIKGNLPGEPGAAAGLFDGIDIDWEYPDNPGNGNLYGPQDIQNFTNMLNQFRTQLDAQGQQTGKHYLLTFAAPSGQDKYDNLQLGQDSRPVDWINLMTYDMHGTWDATGPTDFDAPLFAAPNDPSPAPSNSYSINHAVLDYLMAGVPAHKIVIGIPFYGRGWTNVPNVNHGLYQSSPNMQPAPSPLAPGEDNYYDLANLSGYTGYWDPYTMSYWVFNGTTFWNFDNPTSIKVKMAYVDALGLGGAMVWSVDGDTSSGTLMNAIYSGLNGPTSHSISAMLASHLH